MMTIYFWSIQIEIIAVTIIQTRIMPLHPMNLQTHDRIILWEQICPWTHCPVAVHVAGWQLSATHCAPGYPPQLPWVLQDKAANKIIDILVLCVQINLLNKQDLKWQLTNTTNKSWK